MAHIELIYFYFYLLFFLEVCRIFYTPGEPKYEGLIGSDLVGSSLKLPQLYPTSEGLHYKQVSPLPFISSLIQSS